MKRLDNALGFVQIVQIQKIFFQGLHEKHGLPSFILHKVALIILSFQIRSETSLVLANTKTLASLYHDSLINLLTSILIAREVRNSLF